MMILQYQISLIMLIILTRTVKGFDSKSDEWDSEYDQRLHSSLNGSIRELVPTDDNNDADTRFQPPLDSSNQEHAASEGYRLENSSPNIVPSISLIASNEKVLSRHKRQAGFTAASATSTSIMDGSGVSEEGSTSESTTGTTLSATTVQLTLSESTYALTTSSISSTSVEQSTAYQVPSTTATSEQTEAVTEIVTVTNGTMGSITTTISNPPTLIESTSVASSSQSVSITQSSTTNIVTFIEETTTGTVSTISTETSTQQTTVPLTEIITTMNAVSAGQETTSISTTAAPTTIVSTQFSSSSPSTSQTIIETELMTSASTSTSSSSTTQASIPTSQTTIEVEVVTSIETSTSQTSSSTQMSSLSSVQSGTQQGTETSIEIEGSTTMATSLVGSSSTLTTTLSSTSSPTTNFMETESATSMAPTTIPGVQITSQIPLSTSTTVFQTSIGTQVSEEPSASFTTSIPSTVAATTMSILTTPTTEETEIVTMSESQSSTIPSTVSTLITSSATLPNSMSASPTNAVLTSESNQTPLSITTSQSTTSLSPSTTTSIQSITQTSVTTEGNELTTQSETMTVATAFSTNQPTSQTTTSIQSPSSSTTISPTSPTMEILTISATNGPLSTTIEMFTSSTAASPGSPTMESMSSSTTMLTVNSTMEIFSTSATMSPGSPTVETVTSSTTAGLESPTIQMLTSSSTMATATPTMEMLTSSTTGSLTSTTPIMNSAVTGSAATSPLPSATTTTVSFSTSQTATNTATMIEISEGEVTTVSTGSPTTTAIIPISPSIVTSATANSGMFTSSTMTSSGSVSAEMLTSFVTINLESSTTASPATSTPGMSIGSTTMSSASTPLQVLTSSTAGSSAVTSMEMLTNPVTTHPESSTTISPPTSTMQIFTSSTTTRPASTVVQVFSSSAIIGSESPTTEVFTSSLPAIPSISPIEMSTSSASTRTVVSTSVETFSSSAPTSPTTSSMGVSTGSVPTSPTSIIMEEFTSSATLSPAISTIGLSSNSITTNPASTTVQVSSSSTAASPTSSTTTLISTAGVSTSSPTTGVIGTISSTQTATSSIATTTAFHLTSTLEVTAASNTAGEATSETSTNIMIASVSTVTPATTSSSASFTSSATSATVPASTIGFTSATSTKTETSIGSVVFTSSTTSTAAVTSSNFITSTSSTIIPSTFSTATVAFTSITTATTSATHTSSSISESVTSSIMTIASTSTTAPLTTVMSTTTLPSTSSTTATTTVTVTSATTSSSTTTSTVSTTTFVNNSTIIISTTRTSTSTSTATTATTTIAQTCAWTDWVPLGNCTPTCGTAYRTSIRSCIDSNTGQSCSSSLCGGGSALQNSTCPSSPPCQTLTVTPVTSFRDPNIRLVSYTFPDSMYFFDGTYRSIWVSDKGYISFDTPYYSQTMTTSAFFHASNQAIAAPFWADLLYDTTYSTMTINWFSSTNAATSDTLQYYAIIQSAILSACPTGYCSLNFAAARVVRINWQNLIYLIPYTNQSISVTLSAYLINTYEYSGYSYPILRSYISFDYSNLTTNLGYLRPFVGYRGKNSLVQILNDPYYYQNAAFLSQRQRRNFYVGGRFLSDCEVSYLQETTANVLYPWGNLNDEINNPRVPCPCTLGQALSDRRFGPTHSETYYELSQDVFCFSPMTIQWIWWGWTFKLLRSQTCCYSWYNWGLITSGPLAGSVLSNPYPFFQPYYWLRRILFHDQCCIPSYSTGFVDWNSCQQYYELHPPSSCAGYRPPALVTFNGDPHVTTIDNGRYTCHIQGLFVFVQTTAEAAITAQNNLNSSTIDSNFILPDDLFQIYVQSKYVAPALSYIERTQGYGSIFTNYTIIAVNFTFAISNNNGQFGFSFNNDSSFTSILANNLNYDYTNIEATNASDSQRYGYRLQQASTAVSNSTVPVLILSLWSGLSLQFQIIGENLECVVILPDKFRTHVEGLAGNFNGDYTDDLSNRLINQTVAITTAVNGVAIDNDADVLNACRSWRVPTDTTPDNSTPIMPTAFVNWYYNNASSLLTTLNPLLSPTIVNQTCGSNFECIHDYLIRINPYTSAATAFELQSFQQSRTTLAQIPPTINITSDVLIEWAANIINRTYLLPISINGSAIISAVITINTNTSTISANFSGEFIVIPIPNTTIDFVEVFLTVIYGSNSTLLQYLDIVACLCINNGTCNYDTTTTLSTHYKLASCDCPDLYQGLLCESDYNGCTSGSACRVNWNNGTTCIPLTATQQVALNRSYICNGTCQSGFSSSDNFTCNDINECNLNSSLCGNGTCINLIGSYTCNCTNGFQFNGQTCTDIDECTEPNADGTFPTRCANTEICINTIGSYVCECNPIFNSTGTCIYNSSLCNYPNNDTCVANGTVLCLHNTINVNNSCIPWCSSTCPGFCDLQNNIYQCNCMKYPGFQYSSDGKQCLQCLGPNYGYGCNQSCECVHGTCNANATSVNQSCICDAGYQPPLCVQLIDLCATNSPCNNVTQDCATNPNNGSAICTCKLGYELNNTNNICQDANECTENANNCNAFSSTCSNTIGSYICVCNSGYESMNGSCVDMNECLNASSCTSYNNTYCANTPGSYECRCSSGYSVGGDRTRMYGNIYNTSNTCQLTNYSSDCINACTYPASCSSITGQCTCPTTPLNSTLNLVVSSDPLKETCQCQGYPFVYYNGSECVSASGQTWILLYFTHKTSTSRFLLLNASESYSLENQISTILTSINITCNGSCIDVYDTQNAASPDLQLLVTLNVTVSSPERLEIVNDLFTNNVTYNSSYFLTTVQMIINTTTAVVENFTNATAVTTTTTIITTMITNLTSASTISTIPTITNSIATLTSMTTQFEQETATTETSTSILMTTLGTSTTTSAGATSTSTSISLSTTAPISGTAFSTNITPETTEYTTEATTSMTSATITQTEVTETETAEYTTESTGSTTITTATSVTSITASATTITITERTSSATTSSTTSGTTGVGMTATETSGSAISTTASTSGAISNSSTIPTTITSSIFTSVSTTQEQTTETKTVVYTSEATMPPTSASITASTTTVTTTEVGTTGGTSSTIVATTSGSVTTSTQTTASATGTERIEYTTEEASSTTSATTSAASASSSTITSSVSVTVLPTTMASATTTTITVATTEIGATGATSYATSASVITSEVTSTSTHVPTTASIVTIPSTITTAEATETETVEYTSQGTSSTTSATIITSGTTSSHPTTATSSISATGSTTEIGTTETETLQYTTGTSTSPTSTVTITAGTILTSTSNPTTTPSISTTTSIMITAGATTTAEATGTQTMEYTTHETNSATSPTIITSGTVSASSSNPTTSVGATSSTTGTISITSGAASLSSATPMTTASSISISVSMTTTAESTATTEAVQYTSGATSSMTNATIVTSGTISTSTISSASVTTVRTTNVETTETQTVESTAGSTTITSNVPVTSSRATSTGATTQIEITEGTSPTTSTTSSISGTISTLTSNPTAAGTSITATSVLPTITSGATSSTTAAAGLTTMETTEGTVSQTAATATVTSVTSSPTSITSAATSSTITVTSTLLATSTISTSSPTTQVHTTEIPTVSGLTQESSSVSTATTTSVSTFTSVTTFSTNATAITGISTSATNSTIPTTVTAATVGTTETGSTFNTSGVTSSTTISVATSQIINNLSTAVVSTSTTSVAGSTGSETGQTYQTTVPTTTQTSTSTQTTTISSTFTSTQTTSTTSTSALLACAWTDWVPLGNCTPTCGTAYRTSIRSCIDSNTGQSCSSSLCGGGSALQNDTCPSSPPCQTLTVTPVTSFRDPNIRLVSYTFPDSMYFFDGTYRSIWVSDKGYISFDTPYYSQTMTTSAFFRAFNQAIAAPFWADLLYDTTYSTMTINWFSSTNATASDTLQYYTIIQSAILSACPTGYCSLNFAAARVVRINWQNLIYLIPYTNQSISVTLSAYLINTYEYSGYSYPILRSYISFDYSNLTTNLGYLRPFVGYRGKNSLVQILNDPYYYQNAAFLSQRQRRNFYVGGRFLSDCEVSYLQETTANILNPWDNLNDEINNPRVPCPCTLSQAEIDSRFGRLFSENSYELSQSLVCFSPMTTQWIRWGGFYKLVKTQTCCYNTRNLGLITSGPLAGSVLSNPYPFFQPYYRLRRIPFYDQCCSPSYTTGIPDWNTCQYYYQLHPQSTCSGYDSPATVTGIGDPHVNTVDNGRYTCHIQGLYVFAQTTSAAGTTAQNNFNNALIGSNLIYPIDLFYIYATSVAVSPILFYIQQNQGYGSIFSSYIITSVNLTFNISNNNGNFGFTSSDGVSLTTNLASYTVYDYTNLNATNINSSGQLGYRVQQTNVITANKSVPQLTLTLWSGLSLKCQIIGENLDCILLLPQKFQTHIEGLVGNFNGDYSDDLYNRLTNQTVTISAAANITAFNNDTDVLSACRSWRVPTDTTADIINPIMPTAFVNWYYNNASSLLTTLNPLLSPTIVNQTCGSNFECVHDYLIRINPYTSAATASELQSFQQSRTTLVQTLPTISITSDIEIVWSINNTNRNYQLPISINGSSSSSILVTIYPSNTTQSVPLNGGSAVIIIPMPNNTNTYVEVSLTVSYATNSTWTQSLDITACLCTNNGVCDYDTTTTLSTHYKLASCDCPDLYQGLLCESDYNGCTSGSACQVNWNNGTTCIPLTATQQVALNRSYICNGTCQSGFSSSDNFTCNDINECNLNSSLCGNGTCINLIGSYTCNCTSGFRFNGQTCIDINECTEPNVDGTFPTRCSLGEVCVNTIGNYTCACSPVFNSTGTCIYNSSLCNYPNNDTCVANGTVLCLHNTINVNNSCIPWCSSTCPGFCDLQNNAYQCNCMKYPGFQYSSDGKQCLQCLGPNYGYGCNQSCECVHGTCNANATSVNQSCTCNTGYQPPLCVQLIDLCATNSPCNNVTQDCATNPNNGSAICTCKLGYELNNTNNICQDANECTENANNCNAASSTCSNTIGSYVCVCNSGYESMNGLCVDINECLNASSCTSYSNTYCTNTPGSYECRCSSGYSVGGDQTRIYEDVRNTSNVCLLTNYSSACTNVCDAPASCNSLTGTCQCPASLNLVPSDSNNIKQTCVCPGYPYVSYTSGVCDSSLGQTWYIMYFNPSSVTSNGRDFPIYSPVTSTLENQTCAIIQKATKKTCTTSQVQIIRINNANPAIVEVFVALNIPLNATERLQLINGYFYGNISLNSGYSLKIEMYINNNTKTLLNFTSPQSPCQECVYLNTGACNPNDNTTCYCSDDYEGDLCQTQIQPTVQSAQSANWTVIVAVISAVGGLLLIIAVSMIVFYIVLKCRRHRPSQAKDSFPSTNRETYSIPRVHLPTMGTIGQDNSLRDAFSITTYNDRHPDPSESYRSSASTTYNPTFRTNDPVEEPVFGIFDDLERHRPPIGRRVLPQEQMAGMSGTLSSFPHRPTEDPALFSESNALEETELVTEMLDDMTKDDDMQDDFIEAMNPNVVIPRSALQPARGSSGWFSFFRNS